jgi:hypothetical protein
MSKWRYIDPWSDDDPAVARMREALALRAVEPAPDARDAIRVDDVTTPEPDEAPALPTRRERIAALVARVSAGDLSAVDLLRRLLDK